MYLKVSCQEQKVNKCSCQEPGLVTFNVPGFRIIRFIIIVWSWLILLHGSKILAQHVNRILLAINITVKLLELSDLLNNIIKNSIWCSTRSGCHLNFEFAVSHRVPFLLLQLFAWLDNTVTIQGLNCTFPKDSSCSYVCKILRSKNTFYTTFHSWESLHESFVILPLPAKPLM